MKLINKSSLIIGAIVSTTFAGVSISCGSNKIYKHQKDYIKHSENIYEYHNQPKKAFETIAGVNALNPSVYNSFKAKFDKNSEVGVAIIANESIYFEIIPWVKNSKTDDILFRAKSFKIKYLDPSAGMGYWMQSFQVKTENGDWSEQKHGKSSSKNYGDYYPIYLLNHEYTQLGISNQSIYAGDMIEISYNHNS